MTITTTDALAARMAALDIAVTITSGPNYAREDDGWEHHAYRFTIAIAGDEIVTDASYRAGLGITNTEPADIMGSVIADLQSVEPYADGGDWLDWAEDLGTSESAKDLRRARDAYEEITTRRAVLRERLDADAYESLLDCQL